jgi:hypothetical protein
VTRLVASAYGRCFALEIPAELEREAITRWPFGSRRTQEEPEHIWRLERGRDRVWTAGRDGRPLGGGPAPLQVLDLLMGDLELWVAEHADGLVFVHAGAVAWRGGAIVIPGRTRAGKSTLVAALVRAGADYLSDEYAVVDRDGRIHPYARALCLRSADAGPPARTPVQELGGTAAMTPVPLRFVAHVRYEPDSSWKVQAISAGASLLALLENTVPARSRPEIVMDHLQAAVFNAIGFAGRRGDAPTAARHLLQSFDRLS